MLNIKTDVTKRLAIKLKHIFYYFYKLWKTIKSIKIKLTFVLEISYQDY